MVLFEITPLVALMGIIVIMVVGLIVAAARGCCRAGAVMVTVGVTRGGLFTSTCTSRTGLFPVVIVIGIATQFEY
jgi:hypothetical protein